MYMFPLLSVFSASVWSQPCRVFLAVTSRNHQLGRDPSGSCSLDISFHIDYPVEALHNPTYYIYILFVTVYVCICRHIPLGFFVKSTHMHPLKVLHSSNQTLHRTLLNKCAMCRCSSFEKNGMSIPMWGDCSCYVMYTTCNQHRPEASLAHIGKHPTWHMIVAAMRGCQHKLLTIECDGTRWFATH